VILQDQGHCPRPGNIAAEWPAAYPFLALLQPDSGRTADGQDHSPV